MAFSFEAQKKRLKIDLHISDDMPSEFLADELRLRQVISNLISNALKFTKEGGIKLRIRRNPVGPFDIQLSVKDSGIGIAEQNLREIFQPFKQADLSDTRNFGGVGLGLSICHQLMSLMKGKISVSSKEGLGSIFTLDFNGLQGSEVEEQTTTRYSSRGSNSQRILLVEDVDMNREVAKIVLETEGYEVIEAVNGKDAVEKIAEDSDFRVILMDVQMPVMDGIEASLLIRERLGPKTPPIIALTGSALPETQRRCEEAGMIEFLTKPVNWGQLREIISRLGEK